MNKVLCYIDGNFAYFTDDLENQWGDDWNDVPYEHNAGEPYTHREMEVEKLAFLTELETPAQIAGLNSRYSVEDINNEKVPWLEGTISVMGNSYYGQLVRIYAGIPMSRFIELINEIGGEVYKKV